MGGGSLILLDTHALIWLYRGDSRLGRVARRLIDTSLRNDDLAISAISFWETGMLVAKRRLLLPLVSSWRRSLLDSGMLEIPVDGEIAATGAALEEMTGDPADRIILATALQGHATLVTADRSLLDWPGNLARHDARL